MSIGNQENFLIATEILNEIKKNSDKIDYNQTGGFVFSLIASAVDVFKEVTKAIAKGLWAFTPWLIKAKLYVKTNEPEVDENGQPKRDAFGKIIYKKKFSPSTPEGEGNLWKYLWFCIKTSLYLVIFALGGFWVTLGGVIYLYTKIAQTYRSKKGEENTL